MPTYALGPTSLSQFNVWGDPANNWIPGGLAGTVLEGVESPSSGGYAIGLIYNNTFGYLSTDRLQLSNFLASIPVDETISDIRIGFFAKYVPTDFGQSITYEGVATGNIQLRIYNTTEGHAYGSAAANRATMTTASSLTQDYVEYVRTLSDFSNSAYITRDRINSSGFTIAFGFRNAEMVPLTTDIEVHLYGFYLEVDTIAPSASAGLSRKRRIARRSRKVGYHKKK